MDTTTLVAAIRSPTGASAEILRRVLTGSVTAVCSVPLFLEYEAVLSRTEHLLAAGASTADIGNLLDALAQVAKPVLIRYLWRPMLRDSGDDMILEAAVNGQVGAIVTFNVRDFLPQTHSFGLKVLTPADFLKGL